MDAARVCHADHFLDNGADNGRLTSGGSGTHLSTALLAHSVDYTLRTQIETQDDRRGPAASP